MILIYINNEIHWKPNGSFFVFSGAFVLSLSVLVELLVVFVVKCALEVFEDGFAGIGFFGSLKLFADRLGDAEDIAES